MGVARLGVSSQGPARALRLPKVRRVWAAWRRRRSSSFPARAPTVRPSRRFPRLLSAAPLPPARRAGRFFRGSRGSTGRVAGGVRGATASVAVATAAAAAGVCVDERERRAASSGGSGRRGGVAVPRGSAVRWRRVWRGEETRCGPGLGGIGSLECRGTPASLLDTPSGCRRPPPRRGAVPLFPLLRERRRAARAREGWPGPRRGRASVVASDAGRSRVSLPPSPSPGGARSGVGPRDAAVSVRRCERSLGVGEACGGRGNRPRRRPPCVPRNPGFAGPRPRVVGGLRSVTASSSSPPAAARRPSNNWFSRHVLPGRRRCRLSRPVPVPGRGGPGEKSSLAVRVSLSPLCPPPPLAGTRFSCSPLDPRPQIRRGDPLNLSILVSGGKETNQDSLSNGE